MSNKELHTSIEREKNDIPQDEIMAELIEKIAMLSVSDLKKLEEYIDKGGNYH